MPRKPGPAPMSADVISLTGNRSKLTEDEIAARAAAEVRPAPIRPRKPEHLSRFASECWDRHAPELESLGLLTRMDSGAFELACEAYAMAREALEEMKPRKADGTPDRRTRARSVVDVDGARRGNVKRHAAFAVFNMASNTYRAWCVEFGLTPSARVSLRPGAHTPTLPEDGDGAGSDGFDFGT